MKLDGLASLAITGALCASVWPAAAPPAHARPAAAELPYASVLPMQGKTAENPTGKHAEKLDRSSQTVRIFCIGNSWTTRSVKHLCSIARSAGKKAVVGFAFLPHGSLQEHYFSARFGKGTMRYHGKKCKVRQGVIYKKYLGKDKPVVKKGVSLKKVARDERWDYVVYQNRAPESGAYATWDKKAKGNSDVYLKGKKQVKFDINDLAKLVRRYIGKNARHAKVGISAVWSYPHYQRHGVADSISEYARLANRGRVPRNARQWNRLYDKLHRDIQRTIPKVKRHMGRHCDFIANPGEAFFQARKSRILGRFGFGLSTSPTDAHPAPGLPCYLASLSYAYTMLGIERDDVSWYPPEPTESYVRKRGGKVIKRTCRMNEADAELARQIVWNAQEWKA